MTASLLYLGLLPLLTQSSASSFSAPRKNDVGPRLLRTWSVLSEAAIAAADCSVSSK